MTGADRFAPAGALLAALLATILPNLSAPPSITPHEGGQAGGRPVSVSSTPAVLRLRLADLPDADALQPARPRTHTVAPRSNARRVHTVVSGDTMWEIARTSDVSVGALVAANRLPPDAVLRLGQVLNVPPPGTRTPTVPTRLAGRTAAPVSARVPTPARTQTAAQRLPLLWPSSGTITSRFGWRVHPIFGTREFHTGMDIATRWGSPVMAARSGIVRFAGWMSGYGRLIVVDHGTGLQTMYSHLSAMAVDSGQQVAQGQLIGRIGSTGWSTGPHLFFEVRQNGVPQDPVHYLR